MVALKRAVFLSLYNCFFLATAFISLLRLFWDLVVLQYFSIFSPSCYYRLSVAVISDFRYLLTFALRFLPFFCFLHHIQRSPLSCWFHSSGLFCGFLYQLGPSQVLVKEKYIVSVDIMSRYFYSSTLILVKYSLDLNLTVSPLHICSAITIRQVLM